MIQVYPAAGIRQVRFSIHEFLRNQNCTLYITEKKEEAISYSASAVRSELCVNDTIKYMFIESDEVDNCSEVRIEYNESLILENCYFDDNSIRNRDNSPYTFIETVVSMNKALLSRSFPDLIGKWIFNKAEMTCVCDRNINLQLELVRNIGYRIVKTKVFHDFNEVGHIYFSMVKK